jgi:hypothetical protein
MRQQKATTKEIIEFTFYCSLLAFGILYLYFFLMVFVF